MLLAADKIADSAVGKRHRRNGGHVLEEKRIVDDLSNDKENHKGLTSVDDHNGSARLENLEG